MAAPPVTDRPTPTPAFSWTLTAEQQGELARLAAGWHGIPRYPAPDEPSSLVGLTVVAPWTTQLQPGALVALRDGEGLLRGELRVTGLARRGDGVALSGSLQQLVPFGIPEFAAVQSWVQQHQEAGRTVALWPVRGVATAAQIAAVQSMADALLLVYDAADPIDDWRGVARQRLWQTRLSLSTNPLANTATAAWVALPLGTAVASKIAQLQHIGDRLAIPPLLPAAWGGTVPVAWDDAPESLQAIQAQATVPRQGLCVFFTGLSGSGKSTLAQALLQSLLADGVNTTLLDGDWVRQNLSAGLGFSQADRDANVRRIGYVASLLVKHGAVVICAPIAPYAATRQAVRELIAPYGAFIEVHVATDLSVCEARDRKGLYAKARAGLLPAFTGISDPYEAPTAPELRLDTARLSVTAAVAQLRDVLAPLF